MQEKEVWESLVREVRLIVLGSREVAGGRQTAHTSAVDRSAMLTVPQVLRSRSRTRRRRRKRSWYAAALAMLMALLVAGITIAQLRRGEMDVHYQ